MKKYITIQIQQFIMILLLILGSCESKRAANKKDWLERKGYLKDSIKTETIFKPGETKLLRDTTYQFSSDTLRTDSATVITNNYYHEKYFHTRDSVIYNNTTTTHLKDGPKEVSWWKHFIPHGLIFYGLITMIFWIINILLKGKQL